MTRSGNGQAYLSLRHPALRELAAAQAMVVTRRQLDTISIGWRDVACHLAAERWCEPVPGVLVLHRGPLPVESRRWLAVFCAGPDAALCAWTALELRGLRGWERPAVHVVVRRGHHPVAVDGIVVHESRRHTRADVHPIDGLPAHSVERATVDAAAWSGRVRTAGGLVAAVVRQGLSTPDRIRPVLDAAGAVRFRKALFLVLADIEGGAQAMSEIDLARLCRSAGLPEPRRQRVRRDTQGRRRYLDAEWTLPDGSVLAVEVDGVGHLELEQWYDDLMREAELVTPRRHRVIRIPASAVRHEPARVVAILRRALGLRLSA